MRIWSLTLSLVLHAVPFLVLSRGPLSPMLSPIWIEKGGGTVAVAPVKKVSPVLPTAKVGEEATQREVLPGAPGQGGGTLASSVEEWTKMGNPPPDYPYFAQKKGWEGRVELKVVVAPGKPNEVAIAKSSRYPVLDEAAVSWAKACQVDVNDTTEFLIPIVYQLKAAGGRR